MRVTCAETLYCLLLLTTATFVSLCCVSVFFIALCIYCNLSISKVRTS